jgi:tRNA threonylcarbamoyladenosine biosynthesis protein TsaB
MCRILSIETATKVCSVAVSEGEAILGETSLFTPQVHAERLVIIINNLLENLKLSYSDLSAVAVSIGPGSFTGLRIGLSVAKGISFAQNKKLISVPTLEAIARCVLTYEDQESTIVPMLHARANEFYYSSFRWVNSEMEMMVGSKIAESEDIVAEFSRDVIFVGEGVVEFSKSENVKEKFSPWQMKNISASAKAVAMIAHEKFRREEFADLRSAVPMYIKDFIAVKGNPLKKLLEKF